MTDPNNGEANVEPIQQRTFTEEQVNSIIEEVTRRLQSTRLEETEKKYEESDLPENIAEELQQYSNFELQKALLKYKKSVHKYKNEDWVTAETINPNFTGQLKEWKVDAFQLVTTIYKHTETTRVQAKAATEIYEQLQTIVD